MLPHIDIELLPDDEYALWEQAVNEAEQQNVERSLSRALQPEPLQVCHPAAQDQEATSADHNVVCAVEEALPEFEDFGLKVNRRAKHRPRGLRVTDITGAEWCQQQLAFALSARLPKVKSLSVSSESGRHHAASESRSKHGRV